MSYLFTKVTAVIVIVLIAVVIALIPLEKRSPSNRTGWRLVGRILGSLLFVSIWMLVLLGLHRY